MSNESFLTYELSNFFTVMFVGKVIREKDNLSSFSRDTVI